MKIVIPDDLKLRATEESKTELVLSGGVSFKFPVSYTQINQTGFVDVPNNLFDIATTVAYRCEKPDGTVDVVKFQSKHVSIYRGPSPAVLQSLRQHKSTPYSIENGWEQCLKDLDNKILEAQYAKLEDWGERNLIYYSVYFDNGYVELFDKSVRSLLAFNKPNYDILVITDNDTRKLIQQTEAAKLVDLKYHITESPVDGVEASMRKLDIFDFEDLIDYQKVLFLDCDIVAVSNINKIFDLPLNHDVFYSAYNTNLNVTHFKTVHHGFECLPEDFVLELRTLKQLPFNAGQFLFRVSDRMREHFNNIRWFSKNWPESYFFEQCFMCYYFGKCYMIDSVEFQKHVRLISTKILEEIASYDINKDVCLVHFIAPPLDAKTKLAFIDAFEHKFEKVKKTSMLSRFKSFLKL